MSVPGWPLLCIGHLRLHRLPPGSMRVCRHGRCICPDAHLPLQVALWHHMRNLVCMYFVILSFLFPFQIHHSLPIKYQKFVTTHLMTKHSLSNFEYLCSAGFNFSLAKATGLSSPFPSWHRTSPSATSNASVCRMNGLERSGVATNTLLYNALLILLNASSFVSVHFIMPHTMPLWHLAGALPSLQSLV